MRISMKNDSSNTPKTLHIVVLAPKMFFNDLFYSFTIHLDILGTL